MLSHSKASTARARSSITPAAQLLWGGGAGGVAARMDPCRAAALLRHVMARAAASPPPALGPGAHEFLSMVRGCVGPGSSCSLPFRNAGRTAAR